MSTKAGFTTYPRMTAPSTVPDPLAPNRPLFSLLPHPEETAPPQPPRPELAPPPAGWTRSYHAAPGAYPKELAEAHGTLTRASTPYKTADAQPGETKEERAARWKADADKCSQMRYDVHNWTYDEVEAAQPRGHWLAAERWRRDVPSSTGRGKVLVCTHANGLHKEHWHVALRSLLARDPRSPGAVFGTAAALPPTLVEIDDIWLLDDANHAASCDLNSGRLGAVQAWRDDARDALNFVTHVLPAVYAEEQPGWQLGWTSEAGNMPKVVGIGHSFGGNALVQAAAARPDLFEALFLVDPMVPPHYVPYERWLKEGVSVYPLSAGAIRRRTHWPSREEAARTMRAQPFFAAWDQEVFDLYVSHGLVPVDYDKPDGEVTLATPSWSEAAVFTEPEGVAHGWMALPKVTCPLGFVMANVPIATYGEEKTRDMVWRAPRARNERFPDAGHLITQEKPHKLAESMWRFFTTIEAGAWDKVDEPAKL